MTDCPCGSGQTLEACCEPYISGREKPAEAESLMRARYTAHTQANMGFILRTHHPATRTDIDENATARWARDSEWMNLAVISVEGGSAEDTEARIEFMAHYRDPQKRRQTHHELGVFERYQGDWYFRDAEMPDIQPFKRDEPKLGRNDPCHCGSGKKYKKCCGKA